jgi:hypothetical protein
VAVDVLSEQRAQRRTGRPELLPDGRRRDPQNPEGNKGSDDTALLVFGAVLAGGGGYLGYEWWKNRGKTSPTLTPTPTPTSGCASAVLPVPACSSALVVPSVLSGAVATASQLPVGATTGVLLTWTDPTGGAGSGSAVAGSWGFDVYKSTCNGATWVANGRIMAGVAGWFFVDTDVVPGGTYHYVLNCVVVDPSSPNGFDGCSSNQIQISV